MLSLFGTLSAYQFHKKIHQSVQLITEKEAQTENEQVQQQEQSEHEQETPENENNIKE